MSDPAPPATLLKPATTPKRRRRGESFDRNQSAAFRAEAVIDPGIIGNEPAVPPPLLSEAAIDQRYNGHRYQDARVPSEARWAGLAAIEVPIVSSWARW